MEKVKTEIELDAYLYKFYENVAQKSNKNVEEVLSDSLFRFAGFVSLEVLKKRLSNPK